MAEAKETVIILDHDEETVRVDTRSDRYAGQARRAGLKEITHKRTAPYMRFVGPLAAVSVRIGRKRAVTEAQVARGRRLSLARTGQESHPTTRNVEQASRS